MNDQVGESPRSRFEVAAEHGELLYQVDDERGVSVFYPRVDEPLPDRRLRWERSRRQGTVYSLTVLTERDGSSRNVALVDLDEGFRIMTTLPGTDDTSAIGRRGRVVMQRLNEDDEHVVPVFYLEEEV